VSATTAARSGQVGARDLNPTYRRRGRVRRAANTVSTSGTISPARTPRGRLCSGIAWDQRRQAASASAGADLECLASCCGHAAAANCGAIEQLAVFSASSAGQSRHRARDRVEEFCGYSVEWLVQHVRCGHGGSVCRSRWSRCALMPLEVAPICLDDVDHGGQLGADRVNGGPVDHTAWCHTGHAVPGEQVAPAIGDQDVDDQFPAFGAAVDLVGDDLLEVVVAQEFCEHELIGAIESVMMAVGHCCCVPSGFGAVAGCGGLPPVSRGLLDGRNLGGRVGAGLGYRRVSPVNLFTTVTAFVAAPATVLALSTLKAFATVGSNMPLLQTDPTQPVSRTISGVPLYSSPAVSPDIVWALPAERVLFVVRQGATMVSDSSVMFTSDRVSLRCTMRVSYAFTQPLAITKITKA
jgi:hypothetical protein